MKRLAKRITSVFLTATLMVSAVLSSMPAFAEENTCNKTAREVTAEMTVGWNLGNSLEAPGDSLSAETSWGNPKTTKAMIDAVKDAGFNTVRVPVSWGKHTSGSNYTIDSAWMARVKEVVDYCIDNDMFVILNTHHDISSGSDSSTYYYPSNTHLESSKTYLSSVWTQISNEFKNYDYHLVFETLNEPRLTGSSYEWWWPDDNTISEAIGCINQMNQTSLDAIRSTGGNNATRCVMVPGYCASISGATSGLFKLPTDSATDRLIVSVHAYTPYNFALNANGTSTFDDYLKSEIDSLFTSIQSISVPVIIGEMSASNKSNSAERVKWAQYYFGKSKQYGVPCMLWDNNSYYYDTMSGEEHGHLNRLTLTWYDEPFIEAIMDTMGVPCDLTGGTSSEIDLSNATTIWTGSATASGWSPAKQFTPEEFMISNMDAGTKIAVKYSGPIPKMAVQGNNTASHGFLLQPPPTELLISISPICCQPAVQTEFQTLTRFLFTVWKTK